MIITQTPLRISFFGGGTDFKDFYEQYDGAVLSTAINKYVRIIVKESFDGKIYLHYSKHEVADEPDKIKHDIVREALKLTGLKGIDIVSLADVPSTGTGLGSSSSFTVGLLKALYAYQGEYKTPETLASEACHIEIDLCQRPIGIQDQYIAAYGGFHLFNFSQNGVQIEDVNLRRRLEDNLLLFNTGIVRDSNTILATEKANIGNKLDVLCEMVSLAREGQYLLENGDLEGFGFLLHRSWELKKIMADGITNDTIDDIYRTALRAGALGGKICGAGGGGYLLLYCPIDKQDSVRQILGLKELKFKFEPSGSKVVFEC